MRKLTAAIVAAVVEAAEWPVCSLSATLF